MCFYDIQDKLILSIERNSWNVLPCMLKFSTNRRMAWPGGHAMWFKALLLTASCLATLHGFETHLGHVRILPVT